MLSSLQQQYERLASQMQQSASTGHPVRKSLYNSSTSLAEMSGKLAFLIFTIRVALWQHLFCVRVIRCLYSAMSLTLVKE